VVHRGWKSDEKRLLLIMKATIKFRTDRATDWYVTREFADEKHLDNYIEYICRTKQGYLCDEVFYDTVKDAEERHWDNVATYNERFSGDDY